MADRLVRERLRGVTRDGLELEIEINVSAPMHGGTVDDARLAQVSEALTCGLETAAALEGFPVPLARLDGLDAVRRS